MGRGVGVVPVIRAPGLIATAGLALALAAWIAVAATALRRAGAGTPGTAPRVLTERGRDRTAR